MATLARRVGGQGLESVMAMTVHKYIKLADHYSKIDADVQMETSLQIVDHMRSLGFLGEENLKDRKVILLRSFMKVSFDVPRPACRYLKIKIVGKIKGEVINARAS